MRFDACIAAYASDRLMEESFAQLEAQFTEVHRRVLCAERVAANRAASVQVIAVSKKQSTAAMQAYLKWAAVQKVPVIFGENYVQEFKQKVPQLSGTFECHLIGPLQRNKAKEAVRLFDVIQSVHSTQLAAEIDKQAAKENKVQRIFLQINISQDENKSGFSLPEVAEFLRNELIHLEHLRLEGLMTITREYDLAEEARQDFRKFALLREQFLSDPHTSKVFRQGNCALSMGMSQDFEIAIAEGATMVRIGSLLFGQRKSS